MFASKERLNYHHLKGCDRALDINGKPFQLKLYPSVTSGGAVEVRDILEKNNLHACTEYIQVHPLQQGVSIEATTKLSLQHGLSWCS
jgi:hypothetical protein